MRRLPGGKGVEEEAVALRDDALLPQEFPKLQKVVEWDSKVQPDEVDWNALLKQVEEKGAQVKWQKF